MFVFLYYEGIQFCKLLFVHISTRKHFFCHSPHFSGLGQMFVWPKINLNCGHGWLWLDWIILFIFSLFPNNQFNLNPSRNQVAEQVKIGFCQIVEK